MNIQPDPMLTEILRERLPRIFAAGADYNDVQTVLGEVRAMADWPAAWARLAGGYVEQGDEALARGAGLSAGEAYRRAALYYHIAQSVHFEDLPEKRRLQTLQRATYAKAAPLLAPPAELLEIPADGYRFAATLRRPGGIPNPPCVIFTPGADSTKEEFGTLEDVFLRRGMATLCFDGPGQSLTHENAPLRPDFEVPIAQVLDVLAARTDIDTGRIGLWGRSFGGYAVLRGARDPRIRACISIGGFYDLADIWHRMPRSTHEPLAFGLGTSIADAGEHLAPYTLRDQLHLVGCPVLIVHSGGDTVCPVEESRRMVDELGAGAELLVYPQGNHVCDNIAALVRPRMADWMAATLAINHSEKGRIMPTRHQSPPRGARAATQNAAR